MKEIAYVVNSHGYIAHFLPIIAAMPDFKPVIFTVLKDTAIYAREILGLEAVECLRDEHVWKGIKQRGIENAILCYQKITGDTSVCNTIQIFHGVSFKGNDLANWLPNRWDHLLIQGEHFWEPYTHRYPDHAHKMHRVTFARAPYYKAPLPVWDKNKPLLYMPTHRDTGLANLLANVRHVVKMRRPVMVKLHPINMRTSYVTDVLPGIFRDQPHAELIHPDDRRYFDYHELFLNSSCLISDFSSVVCEYTLVDKPIVIMRGGPNGGRDMTRDHRHLNPFLYNVSAATRDLAGTIDKAISTFKQGQYPKLFIEKDCTDIVEKIRQVLV